MPKPRSPQVEEGGAGSNPLGTADNMPGVQSGFTHHGEVTCPAPHAPASVHLSIKWVW